MPPRNVDEKNHVLGKKCRACGAMVVDDFPGLLYVLDYTNSPQQSPQIIDLMVHHCAHLPAVNRSSDSDIPDRACADLVGVAVSGLFSKHTNFKKLGIAQIDSVDLKKTLTFLQQQYGAYTGWSPDAIDTMTYLQTDIIQPYTLTSSDYGKAFQNRKIYRPSPPPSKVVTEKPAAMIQHLIDFQNTVKNHNKQYATSNDFAPQQTDFTPTILPADKPANRILAQSYLMFIPQTVKPAKAEFGYYYFEVPKNTAMNIIRYGELYINAVHCFRDITASWPTPWKDPAILTCIDNALNDTKAAPQTLNSLVQYLTQHSTALQMLSQTDIERKICVHLAQNPNFQPSLTAHLNKLL
jgi:hypothetical protein